VAPDQTQARRYLDALRRSVPPHGAGAMALAVSEVRGAHETLAAFRLTAEPSVLVTVATADKGLDAPEVAVVAALPHLRSRPGVEQMVARATRVDPNAGPYEGLRPVTAAAVLAGQSEPRPRPCRSASEVTRVTAVPPLSALAPQRRRSGIQVRSTS
jgi:superfamily II DNA or RNA helicase